MCVTCVKYVATTYKNNKNKSDYLVVNIKVPFIHMIVRLSSNRYYVILGLKCISTACHA